MVSEGPSKHKSELAKPELQRKRKRKRELAKQEEQLKRKRAKSDKLQQRQVAQGVGEHEVVFQKNSKRNKKGLESNLEGTSGESTHHEHNRDLNSSRNGQALNSRSSLDERSMNPECRANEHSKEGQNSNGQQFNSKRRKKEQISKPKRHNKGQQPPSTSSGKEDTSITDCSIQGQELHNAKDNNEGTLQVSMGVKDNKKKKSKKKRDRWGQVLNDAGNSHDTFYDDKDVGKPEDTAHEDGTETFAEHNSHEGEYDNKTVCAGGMPYDTSEEDILSLFKECGPVARVVCMKFADTQRFKGLAFITFETETAASKALSLDGANMGDRLIKVEKARAEGKVLRAPPKREAGNLSVYVGNLDWNVQKIDIKRFFKGCDIDNVRLAVDKNTGDFRGYGHVDFSDENSLEKAIKMNQKQLLGRPVKVSYAVPKGFKGKSS